MIKKYLSIKIQQNRPYKNMDVNGDGKGCIEVKNIYFKILMWILPERPRLNLDL